MPRRESAGGALLHFLPALLLGCVLLARRYPGEAVLLRWARTPPQRGPGGPARAPRPARARPPGRPRGGLLMAFALAVRPPPAHGPAS